MVQNVAFESSSFETQTSINIYYTMYRIVHTQEIEHVEFKGNAIIEINTKNQQAMNNKYTNFKNLMQTYQDSWREFIHEESSGSLWLDKEAADGWSISLRDASQSCCSIPNFRSSNKPRSTATWSQANQIFLLEMPRLILLK